MEYVRKRLKVGGATLNQIVRNFCLLHQVLQFCYGFMAMQMNSKKMFPCSCLLDGEYGLKDISIGVPAIIGRNGIEEKLLKSQLGRGSKKTKK